MTDFLCTLKKEAPGYNLELSFDSIKSALDAALEILAFADADCYLSTFQQIKSQANTTPPIQYENDMLFGDLLLMYRKSHGYSQRNLADLLGVSQRTICYWERGCSPSKNTEENVRRKLSKGEFTHD